ncbi:unnamed protein product [Mesocestoides corti]|uniref:Not3 domain-containing protein n=1 Tax=Mesocestoides corti TaxID=53468 RepID=A0A0R3UIZ0_MESCO|nr:unnamed protein product [Mesocestoides corti]
MADKRKLQCDIDRTLKRVQEGRASFQEILDKFESSNNQTQKEKFEADLKKEIKRLQRFRDQIKTWHTCNDIKDKRPLLEARKLIEQDMERFKIIEKETKTKAYSKEGLLTADAKKDPLQKEKEKLDEWLKQSICALKTKSEQYEYDLENLSNTGKKKRGDKEKAAVVEDKKQKLEFCAYHMEKLETVMRHLDNERLDCSKVRSLKDPIEYVIESIDDVSVEDYRSLYDDMHLEDLGDGAIMTPNALASTSFLDYDPNPSTILPVVPPIKNGSGEESIAFTCPLPPGSSTSSNASSSRERSKNSSEEKCVIAPISSSSTSTPVKEKKDKGAKSQPASAPVNLTAPSSFHLANTSIAAPSPNKKSFAGAASKQQHSENVKPESERTVAPCDVAQIHRENYAKVAGESKKDRPKKEHQQQHEPELKTATPTPSATPVKNEKRKTEEAKERAQSSGPTVVAITSPPLTPSTATETSFIPSSTSSSVMSAPKAVAPTFSVAVTPQTSTSSPPSADAVMTAVMHQQHNQSPNPFVVVHPRDALAPFRNQQLDRQRTLPSELRSQIQALESAYRRLSLPCDTEKSRMLVYKKPISVPSYFPSEPLKGSDTEEYFMKLDAQTLFFLFYYFEGTRAQYLAAKALKRMSWRFHTKYMTWFQRNEEPKQITEEFESGTYIYYDFQTMSQRKKEEFIFLYSFLEDKDF